MNWIKVKDRQGYISHEELKHENKVILVTYQTASGRRCVKAVSCNHGRLAKVNGEVVAFMPMPKPYREE